MLGNLLTKNKMELIYILLMTIAFTTRYGDLQIGYEIQFTIGIILIVICCIFLLKNKDKDIYDLKCFFKMYFVPHLLIHLYTIILMVVKKVSWSYFTTNASVYIPTLIALCSIYMFGEKAYKYNFVALICSWCLSVFISLITKGIYIFPHAILQAYINPFDTIGGLTSNYLELHDLVLALGYIVVYYIYKSEKIKKSDLPIIFMVLLIMILGMKRISILGIFLSVLFIKIIKYVPENKKYNICKFFGVMIFIISYLFIYMVSNGELFYNIMSKFNINVMGRNYYYDAIIKYSDFSIKFLGTGRNSVTKILNNQLSYLKVGGVHSDIIKMYVENGFIVFGLWLWYYLIKITKCYTKRYGISAGILYFSLTIYTFTLYFTDNTENYFICQIFNIIIPITYSLKIVKENKNKEKLEKKNERKI